VSITIEDEVVRQMLQAFAHEIRGNIGCPVLLVIGANATGAKIIVGADIEIEVAAQTAAAAQEVVRVICSKIAETPTPTDVKLYGEGHDS
jgi:hypothetical protein